MSTFAIIVAAGSGARAGGDLPKQYQMIGGTPVLTRTIDAFIVHADIDEIIVVISPEHLDLYRQAIGNRKILPPAFGGGTRQQSVFNGLKAIKSANPKKVLIHDGARPFVSTQTISDVIAESKPDYCALPAISVVDTIVQVEKTTVTKSLQRSSLRAVQTPQGFIFNTIFTAHSAARERGEDTVSDDSSLVANTITVPGDPENIKITTANDITQANRKMNASKFSGLTDIRVGHGYDVHAFEIGEHVILCGEKISFDKKLKGHSDADVAMHTLTDAILGAISQGDIGKHFPPNDDQWKGASSDIFLKKAVDLVSDRGGVVAHCDITIICEAPKLRPHIDQMRQNLADIIKIDLDRISVKATTSEQLGFTGRGEGISATATATIRLPE